MNITESAYFDSLTQEYEKLKSVSLRELCNNTVHVQSFTKRFDGIYIDFSKQFITKNIISLYNKIFSEMTIKEKIYDMYTGAHINTTENRSVLHTALRNSQSNEIFVDGNDIKKDIIKVLEQMKIFSDSIRNKRYIGYTGKVIKNIVNIGIGGSDLGPKMVQNALRFYSDRSITVRFISNVDVTDFYEKVYDMNPEETLFIVASKTFTTDETMTNAQTAKDWLITAMQNSECIQNHMVALSTAIDKVTTFGIHKDNIFEFWDFVGGRYSIWSAIGLSVMISIGYEAFLHLLQGGQSVDEHFINTPLENNIPMLMACISFGSIQFFHTQTEAVLPYDAYLEDFPKYLQQLVMESNGKSVDKHGNSTKYPTSSIVFGECGTNGQHSFHQLLHQGTHIIPTDFIAAKKPLHSNITHHHKLIGNMLAQAQALAIGKTKEELKNDGVEDSLIAHKIMPGNRPSTTILIDKLSPYSLGQLIALYEHKTFVMGLLWDINSFDQWGVELGKLLAKDIVKQLKQGTSHSIDTSTANILQYIHT